MSDEYRLVFSAEVLSGQHPAVVKKRLQAVLKLDDDRMTALFSGKAVVVKKATDEATAVRYQMAFEKAGARLRVLPVGSDEIATEPVVAEQVAPAAPLEPSEPSAPSAPSEPDAGGLSLLPPGADLLAPHERAAVVSTEVDTSHLSVQSAVFHVDEPETEVRAPNVDHLTLAELGAELGLKDISNDLVHAEIDADFELAEVGQILLEVDAAAPPPPPDTSHLSLS